MQNKLILVRHGQSEWNLSGRFTGITDVALTAKGIAEAKNAGALIKKNAINIILPILPNYNGHKIL